MSLGISCLHQELALLVAVPLGVLAGGVTIHLVIIVPTLHSRDVLHVMMSAVLVIYTFLISPLDKPGLGSAYGNGSRRTKLSHPGLRIK